MRRGSDAAAHHQSQSRRGQNLPGVESRFDQGTPSHRLSQDRRHPEGGQRQERRHEEGEDHEETLVQVEGLGLTAPVHQDGPHPASQQQNTHRCRDDPLMLADRAPG